MSKRIALVDADGILYAAALDGQIDCDGQPLQLLSLDAVYARCLERLEVQIGWAKADTNFVVLSDRRNFRTDILPKGHPGSMGSLGYKGQRKASARPLYLDQLRAMVMEDCPYKALLIEGLEADDVCGISAGVFQRQGNTTVIVSPDKDLLQIPGEVITPHLKERVRTFVTPEMSQRWHMYQTLVGDTCDNYRGLPGFGPRKAGDLLDMFDEEELTPAERWKEIVMAYEDKGLTREDALVQARVSKILQVTDWDASTKEPILFEFPEDDREEVQQGMAA